MNKYVVRVRRGKESRMYRLTLLEMKPHAKPLKILQPNTHDVLVLMDIPKVSFGDSSTSDGLSARSMGWRIKQKLENIARLLKQSGWESAKTLYHLGIFEAPERKQLVPNQVAGWTWKDYVRYKDEHLNAWCDRVIAYLERAKDLSHEEIA